VRPPLNLLSLRKTRRRAEVPFRCRGLGQNGRDLSPERRVKSAKAHRLPPRGNDPCSSRPRDSWPIGAPTCPGWVRRVGGRSSKGLSARPIVTSSNAQHDQFNKPNAGQQRRKRDEIIFEPMPRIGKHHVHPCSTAVLFHKRLTASENLLINKYRTSVSVLFRPIDFGFAVCGKNLASISRFVAGMRHGVPFSFKSKSEPAPSETAEAEKAVFGSRVADRADRCTPLGQHRHRLARVQSIPSLCSWAKRPASDGTLACGGAFLIVQAHVWNALRDLTAAEREAANVRACRLAGAISRMSGTYQQGVLTLQRKRTVGNQHVTVKHIHQQVNVTEGGQAVVAGDKVTSKARGRRRSHGRGMLKNER
jgi:hypothetical protein